MSVIAPCITVETAEEYNATIERLRPFADHIHIDVSDGQFAPVQLFDATQIWWPKEWIADVHAMVTNPADYVDLLIAMNPSIITFHAEAQGDLLPIFAKIKAAGIKAGLAILKQTVPSTIVPLLQAVDHVLIFSGDLGHYGGTASMMQLEKIRLIKAINPSLEFSWDGGVNVGNAFTLMQGGVEILNVGGAISKAENPQGIYEALVSEINKQGVI